MTITFKNVYSVDFEVKRNMVENFLTNSLEDYFITVDGEFVKINKSEIIMITLKDIEEDL